MVFLSRGCLLGANLDTLGLGERIYRTGVKELSVAHVQLVIHLLVEAMVQLAFHL